MRVIKRTIKRLFSKPCCFLASLWPSRLSYYFVRRLLAIQLSVDEMLAITAAVRSRKQCRLLVYGLGYDSLFWSILNRQGLTVFLEDDVKWFSEIKSRLPGIKAHLVKYDTRLDQSERLIDCPKKLSMEAHEDILLHRWDVQLVDGPAGWAPHTPGRMKSIYLASQLAYAGDSVFVHDYDRPVERTYSERFLKFENLVSEVDRLCHFRVRN